MLGKGLRRYESTQSFAAEASEKASNPRKILRQRGGGEDPHMVIPASLPVLSGGSHQRLHKVTSLDGRNDDSHAGGNQVNPDEQPECPGGADWPVQDKQPDQSQIRDAAHEHPTP